MLPKALAGQAGTRPALALKPNSPLNEAGMRIDPPPSVPMSQRRRHRRPAAAAARRALQVPGIAGDAMGRRIRMTLPADLRRIGHADEHRAGLAQPGDGRGIFGRRFVQRHDTAAVGGDPALHIRLP
jgi:hypothetical protein